MKIQLSEHFTYKKLFRFTLPSVVMMIFTSIYSVVDGLFVSNYVGENALAAVNIIFPLASIVGAFGFMLGTGGSAEVAKTFGMGKDDKAREYFSTLVGALIALGVFFTIICVIFMRPLVIMIGANEALLDECLTYGIIMLIGITAYMLQTSFQSFFIVAERPKLGLGISLISGLINILLDYIFIVRLGWGIAGAAAGTVAGFVFGGVFPLIYFILPNSTNLRIVRTKPYFRMLFRSCINGCSELMTEMSAALVTILYNYQLMKIAGEMGVAAMSVMMYINFVFTAAFYGFSMGTAPLISYNYGAQNSIEMKNVYSICMKTITVLSIIMALSAQFMAAPVADIFVGYHEVLRKMTIDGFRIFAISFVVCGFNIFGSAFFTALCNGKISAAISFIRTMILQCGMILILPVFFGITGVWTAVVVAEAIAALITFIFLKTKKRTYHYG